MQVRVSVIVKDPVAAKYRNIQPTEQITIEAYVLLDGPVVPRVALLDFEADSGHWPYPPGSQLRRPNALRIVRLPRP